MGDAECIKIKVRGIVQLDLDVVWDGAVRDSGEWCGVVWCVDWCGDGVVCGLRCGGRLMWMDGGAWIQV